MQIYFTASIVGKKYHLKNYQAIIDYLTSKNHNVLAEHILATDESQIRLQGKEERIAFQKKLEDWISHANCMIVEGTFPSISVGYEISLALHFNKPVLFLYSEGDPPSLLAPSINENIITQHYNLSNLHDILDDFVNYIQGAEDQRFTFFITSQISDFLETQAKKRKMPKAVYLRQLIEKEMDAEKLK